ncbi:hypothetical protein L226DRAFT_532773 [Lentinus tigrinus ALCF2SS1-7]|uniref:Uncharacterized protein n=1 Tax=Lentinus tigrinus ALCF2SS1-6 TaxID=1328759 RepID=A0A5C2SG05_9APHY|nr:hypothetical protein L227DRAFT_651765 [Lentinus tigrinus ALCF2SS1-6]RPD78027.1 hypothetical protein L226DRAFT_532773 [Lentinus tigrinus ALCF2SS1-7]
MLLLSRSLPRLPRLSSLGGVVRRCQSNAAHPGLATPKEFKVVLDQETLYIDQDLAEALGWNPATRNSVPLTLHGWAPAYFAIARTGSDSEQLAKRTVESGGDSNVQKVLEYLKDR